MTVALDEPESQIEIGNGAGDTRWRRVLQSPRTLLGGGIVLAMLLACALSLPWTASPSSSLYYNRQEADAVRLPPSTHSLSLLFGTDALGNSVFSRCLVGGVISLTIGVCAAVIAVVLGVAVGLVAGYRGGWVDGVLMRTVDVLYGLPYLLLVILFKIALERPLGNLLHSGPGGSLVVLFLAIGLVSWLTMARVIRGQVLSLRSLPFVEAARAAGVTEGRIFTRHLLPNLVGPITVYATLTVPQAILQESLLSFLGVGIQPPLPTWGSLASDGLMPALNPIHSLWWLLAFPCILLAVTLLSLNFLGDGLRDAFDPKREAARI
jgi:oligopeptide transport system permease protein